MKKLQQFQNNYQTVLQKNISNKVKSILSSDDRTNESPVIKASYVWGVISKQLKDILDENIYRQWFFDVIPIVIADKVLLLQARDEFSSSWLNYNYQNLVDILLSFQDSKLTCFFIAGAQNAPERK